LARQHDITWICPLSERDDPNLSGALGFCKQVIGLPSKEFITLPTAGGEDLLRRVLAHLHWPRLFEFAFGYVIAPGLHWTPATPERISIVERAVASAHADIVISESIGGVELASPLKGLPKLVSLFDIQHELFRRIRGILPGSWEDRLFYLPELAKIRRYEARYYSQFDGAVTVSEADRARLARICPGLKSAVVHNGVDVDYFQPTTDEEVPGRLMFVGHFGYAPNRDAAIYFCEHILPRIQAKAGHVTFRAVGRDAPAELSHFPGVQVKSSVPDVRPYLAEAAVVVVPLRAGSGTRIKILEAMAMGKAVVSTTLGAEGLDVDNGRHLVLADTSQAFAQAVIDLLSDPTRRESIGRQARKLVEAKYSWDQQAARLIDMIETLAS
jgi:glycosyltransferase involved in cell wall biosynthesis